MDCPNCRLINPPEAERCDCGYDFLRSHKMTMGAGGELIGAASSVRPKEPGAGAGFYVMQFLTAVLQLHRLVWYGASCLFALWLLSKLLK